MLPSDQSTQSAAGYAISEGQRWNVTKSINFGKCLKLADVGFGFQADPTVLNSVQSQSQQWGRVLPKQTLDRSTVLHYVVESPSSNSENPIVQSVELLSSYVTKGMEAESSQAMEITATAK